ncbi:MAG: hypothetical protein WDW36_008925 [Sanguina aurantia]
MVQRFFGKKALEDRNPMGLRRINFDELPDQYVELEKEALALPSDPPQLLPLRRLLANTRLEFSPLRLAYDADRDGWDPRAFHARCGGFGAGLVVACTQAGTVFGGYNPEGGRRRGLWACGGSLVRAGLAWGEDRASDGAFLFTWRGCAAGGMDGKATKLPKVGGSALAVMDKPDSGPMFGADGLSIPLRPKALDRSAKCKLGTYYARMPDGGRSLFGANEDPKRVQLLWLRVFVAEGEGEKWELEGLTWKTSQ